MRKQMLLWTGVVVALMLISAYVTNAYNISDAEANPSSPVIETSLLPYVNETEAGKQAEAGTEPAAVHKPDDQAFAGDFTLTDLKGGTVALSDLRGKGVYLNFWATWCKWCKKEMPDMEKIYAEYKDKGLVILAVSVGEERETVAKYIEDNGYTFDALLDLDKTVAQQYQIKPIPVSFFIDRQGRIVYKKLGTMTEDQMRLKVEQILQ